jgi:soluble lytic murein transglycosylase-like protein
MRGALQTLSRLNAVTVLFAVAAFVAFSTVDATVAAAKPHAVGAGTGNTPTNTASDSAYGSSVAYAVPRNAPSGDVEIILPQPLPPSAVAQYQRILALQDAGDTKGADGLIARLDDTNLVGPILADRYLSANYRSTPSELLDWYGQYGNQPAAPQIYQLLLRKLPRGSAKPPAPQAVLLPEVTMTTSAARPNLGTDSPAWRHAFLAGLAAWRKGNVAGAEPYFIRAATMDNISADDAAAGEFWAARAALRQLQPEEYLNWLQQAAGTGDTFYGMIAGRLLGQGFGPTGIAATLTEADITAVDALPNGHLAFALLQLGETDQAANALRALWPQMQNNPGLAHAVMAVSARAGLVDVAIAIAGQTTATGNDIAGASLPLPSLHPAGGFTIDPALVYALTRTESGFNAHAVSAAGARGLMQLMPMTADFMARNQGISGVVSDPSANLALGQSYIKYLGQQPGIANNLLAILASYNAGPAAAAAWYGALQDDSDPLMFLETIPNDETRRFVHQVLTDSWIYAQEIGLKPRSLDDLAQGNFPQLSNFSAVALNN